MCKFAKLTLGLAAFLSIYPTLAWGYEKELKELAGSLTQKLLEERKKKVAVVDFTDLEGHTTYAGRFLAEELSVMLSNIGSRTRFEVVDRMRLKSLLKEQGLEATGWVDPMMGKKLKKAAGINAIIAGNLTPFGDSLHLSVKILDAGSAKILFAASTDFPSSKIVKGDGTAERRNPPVQAPPRASVNPVSPPPPVPDVKPSVRTAEFVLELLECWTSGPNLNFSMLLTNLKQDRKYKLSTADTRIFDPSGSEYRAHKVRLGDAEDWNSVEMSLANGIAAEAVANFTGVSPGLHTIPFFEITCHLDGIGQYRAQFRDVPVNR